MTTAVETEFRTFTDELDHVAARLLLGEVVKEDERTVSEAHYRLIHIDKLVEGIEDRLDEEEGAALSAEEVAALGRLFKRLQGTWGDGPGFRMAME